MRRIVTLATALAAGLAVLYAATTDRKEAAMFTAEEVTAVMEFWAEPGRYTVTAPDDVAANGPWQVRLTVAGSTWLWNYNRARGLGKGPPGQNPGARNPQEVEWERWIDAKVAWDRYEAAVAAANANSAVIGRPFLPPSPVPPRPGPAPASLIALAGNPPPFAEAVTPLQHIVDFGDGTRLSYLDNVAMRPRYAYYRFESGVMSGGVSVRTMPQEELDELFVEAGLGPSERRIFASVSLLEGGFDSVNTYDTGFVSVGLIQFASLRDGVGSLGRKLRHHKQKRPEAFEADFRRFGIDVTEDGALTVLDPSTGAVVIGAEAAKKVIEDQRLIAVFQRAGLRSRAYRLSQIEIAAAEYFPANDPISIVLKGRTVNGRVADVIKSEAGLATLMDRKVNTGTLDPLPIVLTLVAADCGASTLQELARFERDIVRAMRYRKDYLADTTLSQPAASGRPDRDYRELASRAGNRRR